MLSVLFFFQQEVIFWDPYLPLISYILGKILKGVDIREHGTGNAGTVNS